MVILKVNLKNGGAIYEQSLTQQGKTRFAFSQTQIRTPREYIEIAEGESLLQGDVLDENKGAVIAILDFTLVVVCKQRTVYLFGALIGFSDRK